MCNCIEKLNEDLKPIGLFIELINENELCVDYFACACGSFSTVVKINYCPICGKKLRKGNDKNV